MENRRIRMPSASARTSLSPGGTTTNASSATRASSPPALTVTGADSEYISTAYSSG
ncbi:hypothetical protein [Microbacterium elymi]|uniref:Uncharacterized protein n=1 Tax=Microbacterium elymi TaxID=2909587 RepID=A0ABY5NMR2_9MICO|nr:hypothetical protein [Microbacterium elymi]UUT36472.1 hypothetical protein L2X98_26560 [Microbacterium elymi]